MDMDGRFRRDKQASAKESAVNFYVVILLKDVKKLMVFLSILSSFLANPEWNQWVFHFHLE
jgi:hypothetical protein